MASMISHTINVPFPSLAQRLGKKKKECKIKKIEVCLRVCQNCCTFAPEERVDPEYVTDVESRVDIKAITRWEGPFFVLGLEAEIGSLFGEELHILI